MQYPTPTPENIAILNQMRDALSKEAYLDRFSPKWKPSKGTHNKAQIIKNTFEMFKEHHEPKDYKRFYALENDLMELTSEKDFVCIDGRIIALGAYRILAWCWQSAELIKFVSDDCRDRNGIWIHHQQHKKETRNKFRTLLNGTSYNYRPVDKTKLGKYIYGHSYKHKKPLEFLTTLFAYYQPWFFSREYLEASEELRDMFDDRLYFLWNSYVSVQSIIKSLAIVLGQFLRHRCDLSMDKAGGKIIDIFRNLFYDVEFKISKAEIFKNIYLKSVLMGVPIYGSNKLGYRADEPQLRVLATMITNDVCSGNVSSEWHNLLLYNTCRLELDMYPLELLCRNR